MASSNRTKIFISYSHKDRRWLHELLPHLNYLEKNKLVDLWSDAKIRPGDDWQKAIEEALVSTRVAILLLSIDFLNSPVVVDNELLPLLAAAETKGVKILPVVLRPCVLPERISMFQAINDPSRPVAAMKRRFEREELWAKLAAMIGEMPTEQEHVQSSEPDTTKNEPAHSHHEAEAKILARDNFAKTTSGDNRDFKNLPSPVAQTKAQGRIDANANEQYKELLIQATTNETINNTSTLDPITALSATQYDNKEVNQYHISENIEEVKYTPDRLKIFFCYAREDEWLLKKLKAHLQPLQRHGPIDFWYDRDIRAGTEWKQEIDEHINSAQIILLLISQDFMSSNYCYGTEMQRAMERHERKAAKVIPIILRPVRWKEAPFSKLQALPTDGKPLVSAAWHSIDEAFVDVVDGISLVIEKLFEHAPTQKKVNTSPFQNVIFTTPHLATNETIYAYQGHRAGLRALAWSPTGRQIVTASDDYTAQVWDAFTGQQHVVYQQHSYVEGVAWSPDSQHIVSGCADGTAQIWNAATGEHIYTYTEHIAFYHRHPSAQGHPWVNRVAWSPDGTHIVSCDQFSVDTHTATVRVWNANTGETVLEYEGHRNGVYAVEWSPDGKHIASAGYDRTLQIWEAATGRLVTIHGGSAYLFGLSWSPSCEQVAVGGSDNNVLIVAANNRKVLNICRGHFNWVKDVTWSPDGKYIASGSDDGFVIIWDAATGANIYTYKGYNGHINAVRWSSDGKAIASGGDTVNIWQIETGMSGTPNRI